MIAEQLENAARLGRDRYCRRRGGNCQCQQAAECLFQCQREQFEAWADIIRTGQMEQSEVPKFMEENPEFAEWYAKQSGRA